MNDAIPSDALRTVLHAAERIRTSLRLELALPVEQSARRLLLEEAGGRRLCLVGLLGGASSGKSTLFNNLLGGRLVSRVTARGHITLGPILAAHERDRPRVDEWLDRGLLFPELDRRPVNLDDDVTGGPGELAVVFHAIDAMAGVILVDLPDFTSESARVEGDVALALLPWFDRILVVADHERWFDRQSFSVLKTESVRYGQQRWTVFNRTREGDLAAEDEQFLRGQGERLLADGLTILSFRRGRGLRRFPPGTLDEIIAFAASPTGGRSRALFSVVAAWANDVLNQNEDRRANLRTLGSAVGAAVDRTLPSATDVMRALMTRDERRQLDVLSRTLRLDQAQAWLRSQAHRILGALRPIPLVGAIAPNPPGGEPDAPDAGRVPAALRFAESIRRRQAAEIDRVVQGSVFWHDLRAWTGQAPEAEEDLDVDARASEVTEAAQRLESAILAWNEKVEVECAGMTPHVKGALGVGSLALVVLLIAVPGPVSVLSLAAAKGAIAGGLTQLLAASGAGALFGRQLGRFVAVVQEKLVGSAEFNAVEEAASGLLSRIEVGGRRLADAAIGQAAAFVLPEDDALTRTLETLRAGQERT